MRRISLVALIGALTAVALSAVGPSRSESAVTSSRTFAAAPQDVHVGLRVRKSVASYGLATFAGRVRHRRAGSVVIERRVHSRWHLLTSGRPGKGGRFVLTWIARSKPGRFPVRAVYRGGQTHVASRIHRLTIRPRRGPKVVVSPQTNVIAPSTVVAALEPGSDGVLRYAGGNSAQVGQIIAIGKGPETPDGFLGRVTNVSSAGGQTVVSTEPATLLQAVQEGSFDEASDTVQNAAAERAAARALRRAASQIFTCSGSTEVSLTPDVSFGASLSAKASWFFGLRSASVTADAHASGTLTAVVQGSGSCTFGPKAIAKWPGPTITFFVGPVPVVITSQFVLDLQAIAQAQASASASVGLGFDAQAGMGWKKGKGFYPIESFGQTFTYTGPTLQASGSVEADVIPKVDVLLYGVAGPEVALKAGLRLSADTTKDPWWALDAPVDLTAALDIPALDLASPELHIYQHTFHLAKADGPFGGGGGGTVTVTNPGGQTATVGFPVSVQIQASDTLGLALTYFATGLPAGLSIDASTGLISGTPTTAGAATVTVSAEDNSGASGEATFDWTVGPGTGSSVFVVEASLPADASTTNPHVSLGDVSCGSVGNCSAVGGYADSSGNYQALIVNETDGSWGPGIEVQLPGNAPSPVTSSLGSVSCVSAGNCTAVGQYADSSGHGGRALIVTEADGIWGRGFEAQMPVGATDPPDASLKSVSCASQGDCSAVGYFGNAFDSDTAPLLIVTEANGVWARGMAPSLPANADVPNSGFLNSVSCPSAGNCSAVGQYWTPTRRRLLLLMETNGIWGRGLEGSLPANASYLGFPNPSSVSCASSGNCSAVGNYEDSNSAYDRYPHALIVTETEGTWGSGIEASLPQYDEDSWLASVSCGSAGYCSAVGFYDDAPTRHPLIVREVNGVWGTGVDAFPGYGVLESVSCASAGNCTAVGYGAGSQAWRGALLTETDGTWGSAISGLAAPNASSTANAVLGSVSCAAPGNCAAVGTYGDSSGKEEGLLVDLRPDDAARGQGVGHVCCNLPVWKRPREAGARTSSAPGLVLLLASVLVALLSADEWRRHRRAKRRVGSEPVTAA